MNWHKSQNGYTAVVINRSEVVRRIFLRRGRIPNALVHDDLHRSGLSVSDSVINAQRKRLIAAGRI